MTSDHSAARCLVIIGSGSRAGRASVSVDLTTADCRRDEFVFHELADAALL